MGRCHQIPASSGQEVQKGTVDQQVVGHKVSKFTCSPTCSGNCFYSWFRDDHRWIPDHRYTGGGYWQSTPTNLGCSTTATVWIKSTRSSIQDRYSCNISNYIQPPSDCELGEKQWGVTYTPDSVCALEGSSVRLSCSYKYPGGLRVTESFWFINEQHVDLRDDDQYKGRVQYYQTQLYHTVRITDLRASDSQIYKFRFITDDPGGKYIGSSGVSLSVTGVFESLQVKVEGAAAAPAEGQTVTLTCSSMCSSQSYSIYTWYRNGQPVSECRSASCSVAVFSGEISYSCAVEGRGLRYDATPKPGDDTYTALNLATTSSSEYDTLTHATHSPSDTYSTLNPATRTSSEYDTLTVVGPPSVQSGAPDEENN
ncbi:uncharacterized protein LOC125804986 [Astyanax mexicanus]|uniref:uncharacterized protein LOC125804986 n=1 Tax=Astyanax mexicanus TaxID=7994 RepID=UPI0020CB3867|nr:uncharacterized protein LOC125804986 [Astyanax mexicanus]